MLPILPILPAHVYFDTIFDWFHRPRYAQIAGIFGSCQDFKVLGPRKPSGSARSTRKRVRIGQSEQPKERTPTVLDSDDSDDSDVFSQSLFEHQMNRTYWTVTFPLYCFDGSASGPWWQGRSWYFKPPTMDALRIGSPSFALPSVLGSGMGKG